MFYTYILRYTNHKLYVGSCENIEKRFEMHKAGNGARFTKQNTPQEIIHYEAFPKRADAMKRGAQIKKWSLAKKEALIAGDVNQLRELSIFNDHSEHQ